MVTLGVEELNSIQGKVDQKAQGCTGHQYIRGMEFAAQFYGFGEQIEEGNCDYCTRAESQYQMELVLEP